MYVLKHFRGERAVPGKVPLHTLGGTLQQEPCDTNVPSGLVQVRFFGLFLGILGAKGTVPRWHLVQYLCETQKVLHERHVWKTLNFLGQLRQNFCNYQELIPQNYFV